MDNVTLIVIGLIVAIAAALGLGFALFGFVVSLKDSHRRQRSGLVDEYRPVQPPTGINNQIGSSKSIQFGEVIEGDEQNYFQEAFVTVRTTPQSVENCPICLNFISSDLFECPSCKTQYHRRCFSEMDGPCRYCKG